MAAPALAAPPNDNFASAQVLSGLSGSVFGSNTGATDEPNEPFVPSSANGVWYRWTAPGNGSVSFNTCGGTLDTVVTAFSGNALAGLTQFATNDDDCGAGKSGSRVVFATAGQQFSIRVAGYSGAQGAFVLGWQFVAGAPVNDNFADATVLWGAAGSVDGSNTGATDEPGEPSDSFSGLGVWYRWTAPGNGSVSFNTCGGGSLDTVVTAFSGSALAGLTQVARNDDGCGAGSTRSMVVFATAGEQFSIRVSGFRSLTGPSLTGSFTLAWAFTAAGVTALPDLVPSGVVAAPASVLIGVASTVSVTWMTANSGTAAASAPWNVRFLLSSDVTLSSDDTVLSTVPYLSTLAPGAAVAGGPTTVVIPSTFAGGTYHLLVELDSGNVVGELSETNNIANTTIIVANAAPTVYAGADQIVNEGATVVVAATATDAGTTDPGEASVSWGDGSAASHSLDASHVYADNGVYTVTVTVTDLEGAVGTDTLAVTVLNVAPSLGAITGPPATVPLGSPADVAASFTDPGAADTHTASWSWGDGTTSAGVVAANRVLGSHVYAAAGTYVVEVLLTDDDGEVATGRFESVRVVNPTPPTVVATTPTAPGGVSILTKLTATFSRKMDAGTLTAATFTLTPANGVPVGATVSCNDPCLTATLSPNVQLAPFTRYTGMLTTGVRAADGPGLASAVSWTFTTTNAPELKQGNPVGGEVSTGASTGPKITAQFTRAMNGATFTTLSFTLWAPSGGQIPATPAYDAATNTASITPTLPLGYNTTYTVRLATTITSADGIALAAAVSWTFVTTGTMVTKRIDTGAGQPSTDGAGRAWLADVNFKNGLVESFPSLVIAAIGTYGQGIYRDDRSANSAASLWSYNIPIPNGTYEIKLHFVEFTKTASNQRRFSVDIVDTPLALQPTPYDLNNLDIFDQVGKNTALVKTISNVTIADATLTLKPYAAIDYPTIAAIEIIPIHP